jgi:hypothetical protein
MIKEGGEVICYERFCTRGRYGGRCFPPFWREKFCLWRMSDDVAVKIDGDAREKGVLVFILCGGEEIGSVPCILIDEDENGRRRGKEVSCLGLKMLGKIGVHGIDRMYYSFYLVWV